MAGMQLWQGRSEVLPWLFWEIEKSALILGKKALIVSIFEMKFSFEMRFWQYLGEKTPKFFPV